MLEDPTSPAVDGSEIRRAPVDSVDMVNIPLFMAYPIIYGLL